MEITPSFDFSDWWAKETRKGTPIIVKMENPNYSLVEIGSPDNEIDNLICTSPSLQRLKGGCTWFISLGCHS